MPKFLVVDDAAFMRMRCVKLLNENGWETVEATNGVEAAEMYQLWHGLADTRCPPDHSRWLAGRIPHITAHFPEHEDHTNVEENNRAAAFAWLRGFIDSLKQPRNGHDTV